MIVLVTLPKPEEPPPIAYVSHFSSQVHGRIGDEILVDYPLSLSYCVRKWIPAKWATAIEGT